MLFNRMLLARIFLMGAILTEVAGTSSMAMIPENEAGWLNYLPMWLLISFSYLLLAKAAKTISIGIAFALWEGLGIALITVVSVLFLDYQLNAQELIGLALAIVGIVLVTMGETHDEPTADTGSIRRLGTAHDEPTAGTSSTRRLGAAHDKPAAGTGSTRCLGAAKEAVCTR
ncbi:TPA: multidrug transporter [Aeromonas dhakensis]|nr:multidrug transporter [Aeromonas dhakensis]